MEFRWIPGQGVDLAAVQHMKQQFLRPSEAPPVAWFMSEVQEYHSAISAELTEQISTDSIQEYLRDTGGGIKNFGRFEEWVDWFQYLLPYTLERILEEDLIELTISYFINLYPEGIVEEYSGFREDILQTLPQALMSSNLWQNGDLSTEHEWQPLHLNRDAEEDWENAFHAVMFFCLKYLTHDEITSWIASASEIKGDLWNYHLYNWVTDIKKMLSWLSDPSTIPPDRISKDLVSTEGLGAYLKAAEINWESSYLNFLRSASKHHKPIEVDDYFPRENIDAFLAVVKQYNLG